MESTRPIRALTRGLDALTVLNSRDGATVSEVAQEYGCRAPPSIEFWKHCATPASCFATRPTIGIG